MTQLLVDRDVAGPEVTLSRWYLDGALQCFGLEDAIRAEKIPGRTCIPAGLYRLALRTTGRFHARYAEDPRFRDIHRGMIELVDVPGFSDILIHAGNTARDTRGCLLPGRFRDVGASALRESGVAYRTLYRRLIDDVAAGSAAVRIVQSARLL